MDSHSPEPASPQPAQKRKTSRSRRILGLVLALGAIAIWFFPSNVIYLIAEQEDVLLGYYSLERFSAWLVISLILLYLAPVAAFQTKFDRREWFKFITVALTVIISLTIVDAVWRGLRSARYVEENLDLERTDWPRDNIRDVVRHRPPNVTYTVHYVDEPLPMRSYPDRPPGFPASTVTLTTDARGFRNAKALDSCDILTVGDSFTEGSRVSDDQMWPVLIAKSLGQQVYNLGISGSSLAEYRNSFLAHGAGLQPKTLVLMIYEGNDLRGGGGDDEDDDEGDDGEGVDQAAVASSSGFVAGIDFDWLGKRVKSSPIRLALQSAFVKWFGSIGTGWPIPNAELLDWMPIAVQTPAGVRHYAFETSNLAQLHWTLEAFAETDDWKKAARMLRQIREECDRRGIRMVVAYAPEKSHIVMPLVKDRAPVEKIHYFSRLETSRVPDDPSEYAATMWERLDSKEKVVRGFCEEKGIEFLSLTEPMRQAIAEGVQVYYTYDQHWTRLGHEVAAREIAALLSKPPM